MKWTTEFCLCESTIIPLPARQCDTVPHVQPPLDSGSPVP